MLELFYEIGDAMEQVKKREEILEEYKWDLTTIFKDLKEFTSFYEETKKKIENFVKFQSHVMDNGHTLYDTLTSYYEISRRVEKLYSYAHMLSDQDVSNNQNQELVERVFNLLDMASKNSYFLIPEMLKEDYSKIEEFYQEEEKLQEYQKNILDIYKYKEHTLSDEEEKLLSSLGKAFGQSEQTYSLLTDSDLKFGTILDEEEKEVELTDTNYSLLISSKDRRVRKDAFHKLYETYHQFQNSITSTLNGHIKENVTLSQIRRYPSTFQKSLFQDDLEEGVYQALLNTVHENLTIFQKYYALKKEVLGLEEFHLYDVYADLISENQKRYSFDEAKKIVLDGLSILGSDSSNSGIGRRIFQRFRKSFYRKMD